MALFRVKNDMNNAKKSVVVVANAGPTVVVVLGNAIDVDVNKHDDGTSRPEDFCVTSMMKILLVLFVCFFFAYFLTPEFLLSFTKNIHHVSRLLRVEEIPVSPFARRRRSPGAAVDRSARGARESTV